MRKGKQALVVGIVALGTAFVLSCSALAGNNPGTSAGASGPGCRTAATKQHSVQTFVNGPTLTTDTTCALQGETDIVCTGTFVDSVRGPGTTTQTSRFSARADIIAETAVNPPKTLGLGTTTVITASGTSFTTTATNSYDAQRRLVGTTVTNPMLGGKVIFKYSAWDSSDRPTAGTESLGSGKPIAITLTYDDSAHTVIRNIPPNICKVTHDSNGIMIQEECTGTTPSTTKLTILETQQICN